MQLFREKGYGATSVADLLKAADVNSGSLYNFFPGKQELLLAVLDAYQRYPRNGAGAGVARRH
jgi:TetR/AcrR family transcriptional regulator, transcriptional repressor for nem operon